MKKKFKLAAFCAISTIAMADVAYAQEGNSQQPKSGNPSAEENGATSDDIVVTALRRDTRLQSTPISISAVSGEGLAARGITDSAQLASAVPSLVIRESATGVGARLVIRSIQAAGEATVGLYYDDVAMTSNVGAGNDAGSTSPNIRLFDVERVEVLRGPQGTLYGSSSMAGTVRLIFAKPDLTEYSGAVSGNVSSTTEGGFGFEGNAAINVPLVKDKIAIRAVGSYRDQDGYIDNPILGRNNVNYNRSTAGRLLVRLRPDESFTLDLAAYFQDIKSEKNYWLFANPAGQVPEKWTAPFATRQPDRDKLNLYSATGTWDAGFAKLTGIIAYTRRSGSNTLDASNFFTQYAALLPALRNQLQSQSPSASYVPQTTKNFSQEFRVASNRGKLFDWTIGLYHAKRDGNFSSNVVRADPATGDLYALTYADRTTGGVTFPASVFWRREVSESLSQTAGFGEVTLHPFNALSLTAGGRYYNYRKVLTSATVIGHPLLGGVSPLRTVQSNDNGWVYRFNASYDLTSRVLFYGEVSKGFRPGGVNQVIGLPQSLEAYGPDSVVDYEFGLKSTLLNRMLVLNANVFQMDWSNIQTSGTAPNAASLFVSNAGNARIRGFEFETTLRPVSGLTLQANGSYIDAKLVTDQISTIIVAPGRKGDTIPLTPRVTGNASIEYANSLGTTLKGFVRANISYNSSSWTTFRHTDALRQRLPGFGIVDFRVGISPVHGSWDVQVYVNNSFNKLAFNNKNVNAIYGLGGYARATSLPPRTVGVQLRKQF